MAKTTTTTLFIFFFLLLSLSSADDKSAMDDFLKAFGSSPPSGWDSATDFCKWKGVNCDNGNRVTSINLASLSLKITLPSSINTLSQLTTLSLQNNGFIGPLPSLANLSLLQTVFLDNNNFTSIPSGAFSGLSSLQTLSLSFNEDLAPWQFPSELTDSPSLGSFYVNNANMEGPIPDVFGSFSGLQNLRLSYNNLSGSLPGSLNGSAIQNFWVNNQVGGLLTGPIDVVSGMTQLAQVWLHANSFTGSIPDLSACTEIFDLQLRDNKFTGILPPSIVSLPKLENFTINNNNIQGPLPDFPKTVKVVELGNNHFCRNVSGDCDPQVTALLHIAGALGYPIKLADAWTGNDACNSWIFVTCDSSHHVVSVNFAKQGFSGTISPAFANLTSLTELNLSNNNLTGTIPASLASLPKLKKIDLTNNDISGKVPSFSPGVNLLTSGNKNIVKDVAPPGSPGSGGSSSSGSDGGSKGSSVSAGMVVGVVIAVLVFVVVVMFVLYKCYMKKKHRKFGKVQNPEAGNNEMVKTSVVGTTNGYAGVPSELQSQSSGDHGDFPVFEGGNVAISIQVLRQVTNNFSEDNILGRGGFGVVYKGELHDGTKIAVKRMEATAMGTKGMSEFQAEIAVLTKVRHRHLVALLGFCTNGHERLLVYEYMSQGHLGQHLFEWQELGYPPLTWKQRVSIALDVARGVEYLHSLAQTSFIHRDLKPSNILLGDDMRAKVADFGLVKNAPDGKYSVETRLAGTFGYLAPEYAVTGRVTTKIDVYAFGVILMELITGRKALDETMPDERSHLVTWFRRILINKDNIRKSIDAILDPDDETFESICRIAELAGHCTAREPHQRPDMGHAVNVLGPLVEQWKPSSQEEDDSYGIDLHMSLPQALQRWQANEGTSTMVSDMSFSRTQGSIPSKPSGFADSFDSMDCR
ncbi:receptor-like kinase TMK4 [Chenopodium quinoa]|uniref:receptor-like kinase TMK4 n=1 Tax=Chenopodium quinoa TaxID=63459 RepID=UPI000B7824A1|nr:receptor-like kinase TMK4 [Chenopodium quinoa]